MKTNCKNCEIRPWFQHGSEEYAKFCKLNGKYCYYESVWKDYYEEECEDYDPIEPVSKVIRNRNKKRRKYLIAEFVKTFKTKQTTKGVIK